MSSILEFITFLFFIQMKIIFFDHIKMCIIFFLILKGCELNAVCCHHYILFYWYLIAYEALSNPCGAWALTNEDDLGQISRTQILMLRFFVHFQNKTIGQLLMFMFCILSLKTDQKLSEVQFFFYQLLLCSFIHFLKIIFVLICWNIQLNSVLAATAAVRLI